MRFHFGFSKRISIKTLIYFLGTIFVVLLAFFGITEHEIVYADTLDKQPSSFYYYNNTSSSSPIYPSLGSNNYNYYWFITNSGSASFNFTYLYNFSSISCSSGRADLEAAFFLELNGSPSFQQSSNNFSTTYNSGGTISSQISVNSNGNGTLLKLKNVDLSKVVKIVANTSTSYTVNRAIVDRVWTYSCLQDSTANIIANDDKNTQNIINNNNQNTQNIINSQNEINNSINDDYIDTALETGNDFFDNFNIDDSRGFSSIVTAPIQFLRDLLTSSHSCSPLSISFNPNDGIRSGNATWSIPCGDILWSKAPYAIILLWYTIIYGLLGYRILVDMMRFINRTLNPEDTSEYIMDL